MRRTALLLVTLMLLSGALAGCNDKKPASSPKPAATSTIAGVETFGGLSQRHLGKGEYGITYPQSPPVGGAHSPVWIKCGVYAQELPKVNAVHDLEHGAVWITYPPSTPAATVTQLQQYVGTNKEYVLVSPYADQDSPIVVTAWGAQLKLTSPTDPRLLQFVQQFAGNGPEKNVGCATTGATLDQAVQYDAQNR